MNKAVHILVVDDNRENLRVVSNYLKEKGYKIALALNGKEALKILSSGEIDLILLDVMMPGMDGFEVCEKIQEQPDLKYIPIIFLTAKNELDDIVKGFKHGGVDYISKPFKKEELFARVNTHVELKLMREYFRKQAIDNKEARNKMMRMLLDFSKMVDPEK